MRFYTKAECEKWLSDRERRKPDWMPDVHVERIEYPSEPDRIFFVAHRVASEPTYRKPVLLFRTEWGIWPSSENWHLYYKVREAYGDNQLLHDSPGHLFLEHQAEDLASFFQLSIVNGWGGYILTEANYVNAFFSHDEYFDFFAEHSENLAGVRSALGTKSPPSDHP